MSALIKAEIAEGKQRIDRLEQKVLAAKADTAGALHNLNVTTRYASRIQRIVRATPFDDAFANSMRSGGFGREREVMKTSEQGLDLLTQREGKRNDAYMDSVGVWTIGVGHTGPDVHAGLHWTDEQIEEALRKDVGWAEGSVNTTVHTPINQHQFDALVSFIFNVGVSAFQSSTLLRKINEGDMTEATNQFDRWHIPPEITPRRNGEKHQFIGDRFEARIP